MNPNIPEELEAMAFLIGQSNEIDALMMDTPTSLVTNTNTLKKGMQDYIQQERAQQAQPRPQQHPSVPLMMNTPNAYIPTPNFDPMPHYQSPKVDDGQLEFNLEPTKAEEIILLLKEISLKLTKQNTMLEKQYANPSKQERIQTPTVKFGKG